MPREDADTLHFFNAHHHIAEDFTSRTLCAFRLLKFHKNFKIFFTRELTKLEQLRFDTHNLLIVVLGGLSRVQKIFWFGHINRFWIHSDETISGLISCIPARPPNSPAPASCISPSRSAARRRRAAHSPSLRRKFLNVTLPGIEPGFSA